MSRDKQINEMAKVICQAPTCEIRKNGGTCYKNCKAYIYAFRAVNAGYRKSEEVAIEIFAEIENAHEECIHIDPSTNIGYLLQIKFEQKLAELKKKYTEEGK